MQIHHCEQGSAEWFAVRAGIPTASMFATIMAKGKGGGESLTRRTYLHKLAGEIITGEPADSYSNHHMERGKALEPEARNLYAFLKDCEPECVGFISDGAKGCSPDALVGAAGLLEIKTKLPHLLIDALLRDEFLPEHKAQCQGALWIAEREWIDLAVFWPGLPLYVKRAVRDEPFIKDLAAHVDRFNAELAEVVEQVRRYGQARMSEAA